MMPAVIDKRGKRPASTYILMILHSQKTDAILIAVTRGSPVWKMKTRLTGVRSFS